MYREALTGTFLAVVLGVAAGAPATPAPSAVQWVRSETLADVDAAFATARRDGKPLYLYWGAHWCPPCNQVKATVFNRADFAEQSRRFVAVQLDGDTPGAQLLGARFKVSGYPTMVLFNSQGQELTRLPGEVDAAVYVQALRAALSGGPSVRELLAAAQAGRPLGPEQWRQLAWYAWDVDEQQLLPRERQSAVLAQLAAAAPVNSAAAVRLQLKAAIAALETKQATPLDDTQRFAAGAALMRLLGDGVSAREQMDLVTNDAKELVGGLSRSGTAQRQQLVAAWDQAARALQADASLSRTDRLGALYARVSLARLDDADDAAASGVPAPLQAEVREWSAQMDRDTTDADERQSVITLAAALLKHAGLLPQSDALLKANLPRSHSPYYLMSQLAGNARLRGDMPEALLWYQRAWGAAKGPATRAQWGASYVAALVDLAADDAPRIENAAAEVIAEIAAAPDAFYERNARSLQRIGTKLQAWNVHGKHQDRLDRLALRLTPVCAQLPAGDSRRALCDGVLRRKA